MHRLGFAVGDRSHRLRLERLVAGRTLGQRDLPPPAHLSLRDSRTLNLALAPPEPVGGARLVLSRAGVRHELPLTVERLGAGGSRLLTATATLRGPGAEPDASGLHLADGVWRLTVVTTGPEGRVRRRGLTLDPEVPPPDARADARPDAPIRIVRRPGGRAALQVTRPQPHAELLRLEPRGDGATVHGRLVGAPPTGRHAEAVRRRDGVAVRAHVTWHGGEFSFDLPLGGMAGAGPGEWVWDFRLCDLPLARRLTGVRDPAAASPAPYRVFALPCGSLARTQACFTKSGAFAMTCLELLAPLNPLNPPASTASTASTEDR